MDEAAPFQTDTIDYEKVRQRFPWAGLVDIGEPDLSARYREIMAEFRPRPDRGQDR